MRTGLFRRRDGKVRVMGPFSSSSTGAATLCSISPGLELVHPVDIGDQREGTPLAGTPWSRD